MTWLSRNLAKLGASDAIDGYTTLGLLGTRNSLAYRVHEIEKHLHNSELVYGNSGNDMLLNEPVKFTVVGGDNAWGTELMLCDGTIIESGSSTKKFDLNRFYLVYTSAANKISAVEILMADINTPVACTFDFEGGDIDDEVISASHGLADGDKIVLKAGAGALPAELNDYTVYYVVNKAAGYFNVALTSGGAKIDFTDDGGACFWYPVESAVQSAVQTSSTSFFISAASVNNDASPLPLLQPRHTCNERIFIRAKSESGQTVSIGFLLGLHVYDS